ncbi:rhodanese-like domain-containing protein [Candidatus Woesearchaeota archaeon]|nr:MAG: rhodanese-like domain-containing protein [Candidatus Woesearchaeota archaeon]
MVVCGCVVIGVGGADWWCVVGREKKRGVVIVVRVERGASRARSGGLPKVSSIGAVTVLKDREEYFLLDIREGKEHLSRIVEGALWMPSHELVASWGLLPRRARIVVLDDSVVRSRKAAAFLCKMGLVAKYLRGGLREWWRALPESRSLVHR